MIRWIVSEVRRIKRRTHTIRQVKKLIISGVVTIHSDNVVDVAGDVHIPNHFDHIPVTFGRVSGNFCCSHTKIRSLAGSPKSVGGNFTCSSTAIESLDGAPVSVGKSFVCDMTTIRSLKGSPQYVGAHLMCRYTDITTVDGISPIIEGNIFIDGNANLVVILPVLKVRSCTISPFLHAADHILNKFYQCDGFGDIILCQEALIDAGFAKYARMK